MVLPWMVFFVGNTKYQGGHQPSKSEKIDTGRGKVGEYKKSLEMCFGCGVLLQLWYSQNKHIIWVLLSTRSG